MSTGTLDTHDGWRGWVAYAAAVVTLLAAWQTAALVFPSYLVPPVWDVLARMGREAQHPAYLEAVLRSLARLGTGYSVALVAGITLGLTAGIFKPFRIYMRALISILQSVPPVAWVPLLIILMGFGDGPIIAIIILASFFPIALSVMNATDEVQPNHLHVARLMGANRWQLMSKVYGPEVLPAILTGAQVGFGNAWRSLIAAEMVGGVNVGLGWSITFAGEIADMTGVLLGITTIGLLAAILDRWVLERAKRRLLHWRFS